MKGGQRALRGGTRTYTNKNENISPTFVLWKNKIKMNISPTFVLVE